MNGKQLARVLLYSSAVLFVAVTGLAFVFPKFMAVWSKQGEGLPGGAIALAPVAEFCQNNGLLLLPLLLAGVVSAIAWHVAICREEDRRRGVTTDRCQV